MKVVILAGGFGSRLDEATNLIPKPLVKIGKDPIIIHIMKIYLKYKVKDFYIALAYKGDKLPEEIGLSLIKSPKEPIPKPASETIKKPMHRDWMYFLR